MSSSYAKTEHHLFTLHELCWLVRLLLRSVKFPLCLFSRVYADSLELTVLFVSVSSSSDLYIDKCASRRVCALLCNWCGWREADGRNDVVFISRRASWRWWSSCLPRFICSCRYVELVFKIISYIYRCGIVSLRMGCAYLLSVFLQFIRHEVQSQNCKI